ncbi:phage holin family protein [Streptomyces sp. NRRL F-5123]|uniref:phage holin family protein n=1 Tax=Streptomyces sp. NRRL F-5123 TaxID=1463856 RepID=UPI0004E26D78|nr:phage holin family protein [Streptomyces sp. NRRL F-5123]
MSAAHNGDSRSVGQLFAAATAEMSALVHDEIALAKAELRADAKRVAFGSAAMVAALALALFSVPMLSLAAAWGLKALGMTTGWAFLLVFGAYVFLALLVGAIGLLRFKAVKKPERSINSAKQTAAVLQKAKPRPRELPDGAAALRGGATESSRSGRALPSADAPADAKV